MALKPEVEVEAAVLDKPLLAEVKLAGRQGVCIAEDRKEDKVVDLVLSLNPTDLFMLLLSILL